MKKYFIEAQELFKWIKKFEIRAIPRKANQEADVLKKYALRTLPRGALSREGNDLHP